MPLSVTAAQPGSERCVVPSTLWCRWNTPCHVLMMKTMVKVDLTLLEAQYFACSFRNSFAIAESVSPIIAN